MQKPWLVVGEVMFSTLAWFQNYEDDQRGDRFEGTRKYFPVGGLEVTRTERDGKAHPPVSFKAPTESLQSRARAHNHIFIYSTSLKNGLAFDDADACVEIGVLEVEPRYMSPRPPRGSPLVNGLHSALNDSKMRGIRHAYSANASSRGEKQTQPSDDAIVTIEWGAL